MSLSTPNGQRTIGSSSMASLSLEMEGFFPEKTTKGLKYFMSRFSGVAQCSGAMPLVCVVVLMSVLFPFIQIPFLLQRNGPIVYLRDTPDQSRVEILPGRLLSRISDLAVGLEILSPPTGPDVTKQEISAQSRIYVVEWSASSNESKILTPS